MLAGTPTLHLFTAFGIELEYMIVHNQTLSVMPIADIILNKLGAVNTTDVKFRDTALSNELVLHVIELKTNGPAKAIAPLPDGFLQNIKDINDLLKPLNACLMPTAMHPWMEPHRDTNLWPHGDSQIYRSYDRIFGCHSHGYSNLQSLHINLPFADDEEFAKLHAAIRLLLPIMPGLAASSPIIEGKITGIMDNRLEIYRKNSMRIPSITGKVIPEPVFSRLDYENKILKKMYQDIAPHDPEKILQYEWLNSRGAIARFDRNTIEIRILDVQECPLADMAISAAIVETLKALVKEEWSLYEEQKHWKIKPLEKIFLSCIKEANQAVIDDPLYLKTFGFNQPKATVQELWNHIINDHLIKNDRLKPVWFEPLSIITNKGPLSRRIIKALNGETDIPSITMIYRKLCDCLAADRLFID